MLAPRLSPVSGVGFPGFPDGYLLRRAHVFLGSIDPARVLTGCHRYRVYRGMSWGDYLRGPPTLGTYVSESNDSAGELRLRRFCR